MKKSANFYLILTLIVNIALVGCRILSGNEGSDEDGTKTRNHILQTIL